MTKAIILSNGVVKNMTYEEVLVQFDKMLNKYANEAIEKIVFNKPEKEEVMQELRIQTWEAYRRYNGVNAFSTYLVPRLQHGIHRATTKLYAKKRTNNKGSVSIHQIIGSEDGEAEFEGLLGEEDVELLSLDFREFMSQLEQILKPDEKKILKVLIDRNDFSVQDLANELGMSRQAANKKVNKFKEKMADIMIKSGYTAQGV